VESFGARLKRERERRKITLGDISISTKIGTRFLLAIEEEHFDQLPGGIFNKAFVRAYAHHLGIDEDQAIADYMAASGTNLPQPQAATDEVPDPQIAALAANLKVETGPAFRIPWGTMALVLLIAAFVLAGWGFYNRQSQPQSRLVTPPPAQSFEQPSPPELKPATSEVLPSGLSHAAPAITNSSTQSSTGAAPVETASLRTQASAENASSTAAPTRNFSVSVKARENSWLSITADGKQVVQDTIAAPAEKSVEAQKEVVVHTENLGALEILFNGQKVAIAGSRGEVKTLVFDAHGLQPAATDNSSPQAPPAR
jgi:cytoskeleton protein RodZ